MKAPKIKWILAILVLLGVSGIGLFVGKWKNSDSVSQMYSRQDFSLLDDSGAIFRLKDLPKEKKLLLIFTPDGLPPIEVVAFFNFSQNLFKLQKLGIEVVLITRTNREIVRNFKLAAKFPGRILLDPSGSIGKLVGVWPEPTPVDYWAYALVDSNFKGFWLTTNKVLFSIDDVLKKLPKF